MRTNQPAPRGLRRLVRAIHLLNRVPRGRARVVKADGDVLRVIWQAHPLRERLAEAWRESARAKIVIGPFHGEVVDI